VIAVSGATGFLGAHVVCNLLLNKQQVKAFKRKNSSLNEFNLIFKYRIPDSRQQQILLQYLQWVEADILDIPSLDEALNNVHTIYHCAALVSFYQKDYNKLMQVNITGTANMVNMALIKGIKKFCYASSVAALGRKKSGELITENAKWEPGKLNTNYAISKYKAELEVWRGKEEGLEVYIVNPTVILGIGDFNKGSNKLIKTVMKGLPFYTHGVNGYVDVEDVANAMCLLVQKELSGERYIIVGECLQNKELFYAIADAANVKRPPYRITKFTAEIAWRVAAVLRVFFGFNLDITKETARSSQNKSFYSNQKYINATGYKFKPIKETIANCINFIKQNQLL
jgi:nucleoside-diphosphate-sugar epimerase